MSILSQWVHLISAVIAVGGSIFLRLVLMPALQSFPEEERKRVLEAVLPRFRQLLWASIAGLLVTGLYNLGQVAVRGGLSIPGYLHVVSLKVALALLVFALAFMLTIPGPAFSAVKQRRRGLLLVNVILGTAVVLLSAWLRRM